MAAPTAGSLEWLNYHHLRYFWAVAREGSVSRAAQQLRLAQPTVSEQIRALEHAIGERLLARAGRGVVLTEVGKTVYAFADEIFRLGRDLQDTIKGRPTGRPSRLGVGILDAVPKLAAFRILEPVLAMDPPVRLVCVEDTPERLLDRLSTHELDVVLADAPIGPSHASRAYNHLLGECRVGIFGTPRLARAARRRFPDSLAELPFLLPTTDTTLRRSLDAWLDQRGILPNVVAELEDSALIVEFGALGAGLFAAPDAIMEDALRARGLQRVGSIDALRERYYAISIERKLAHPAVVAIAGAARRRWFAGE
jgi:LysR family transcriptional regulator, transcriptional activator of nhaA